MLEIRMLPAAKNKMEVEQLIMNNMGHFIVVKEMWEGPPVQMSHNARVVQIHVFDKTVDEAYMLEATTIDDIVLAISSILANKPMINQEGLPYTVEFKCILPGYKIDGEKLKLWAGEGVEDGDL